MKTLILSVVAIALSMAQIHAQALSDDLAFGQTVAKSIRYPALAHQQRKVSEAYVNFKVDPKGNIINVSILNAAQVDESFQKEISRVWDQLPQQDQKCQGDYVVPVSFVLDTKNCVKRPNSESSVLNHKPGQYTLLKPVVVTGYL